MKIGINCGHTISGSIGCGAVGFLNESDETRAVGEALMDMLTTLGHTVVDCTNDIAMSVGGNLKSICELANAQPLDMFVSIHFNAGGGKGSEIYTYGGKDKACAQYMLEALEALGFKNRGIKDGSSLYVVKNTTAPAALVEVCFVDTESDANLYNEIGANGIAKALCYAITGQVSPEEDPVDENPSPLEENKSTTTVYNDIESVPSWATEAVKWAVDNKIIIGDGNGLNLNENKIWTLVVLYRSKNIG